MLIIAYMGLSLLIEHLAPKMAARTQACQLGAQCMYLIGTRDALF